MLASIFVLFSLPISDGSDNGQDYYDFSVLLFDVESWRAVFRVLGFLSMFVNKEQTTPKPVGPSYLYFFALLFDFVSSPADTSSIEHLTHCLILILEHWTASESRCSCRYSSQSAALDRSFQNL